MRPPISVHASELGAELEHAPALLPDLPAVFLLWAASGTPYLAKTSLLRRRLKRLLSHSDRLSRVLRLGGVVERIDYWRVGSQLEATLIHLELAQRHFPDEWQKITRLRLPAMLRLTVDNPFPRTMVTTRLGRGLFHGPFPSRAAAERFQNEVLDLFQVRRCEENLEPTPQHPGCIYGEMNKCSRPCQAAVSVDEYAHEAARLQQFLRTGGTSLLEPAEAARDRASAEMQFEEAERLHQRIARIKEVASAAGELGRTLDQLAGVAVVHSVADTAVDLWFMTGGRWLPPRRLLLADTVDGGQSMDRRVRELAADLPPAGAPNLEHLSILMRWQCSSWRDGEWISFDAPDRIPYRKIVNAIARVMANKDGPSA
ncbi:MAG: UvrB/UvrC motif-containing protein [Acidobacteriota bacterium]